MEEYVLSQPWLKTNTEGYDHDGNHIAEQVNKKLNERCRVLLMQATGNRKEFEELAVPAMEHSADVENLQPEAGPHTPAEKAGAVQQLDLMKETHPFGCKAVYYEVKERRDGNQTDMAGRLAVYVGRARKVLGGHRLVPITKDKQTGLWVLGAVVERKTARFQDAVYPLRDGKIEGTAAELSEVLTTLQRRQMLEPVYVVDRIHDSRNRDGEKQYKVSWKGYAKTHKTWEPAAHLLEYGAKQMVEEFIAAQEQKAEAKAAKEKRKNQVRYVGKKLTKEEKQKMFVQKAKKLNKRYVRPSTEWASQLKWLDAQQKSEVTDREAVKYLMAKHELGGTVEQHLVEYRAEKEKLQLKRGRLRRLTTKEVQQFKKGGERFVSMRMNPEYHKPTDEYPDGRSKMRWIVQGLNEPESWKLQGSDAPTGVVYSQQLSFEATEFEATEFRIFEIQTQGANPDFEFTKFLVCLLARETQLLHPNPVVKAPQHLHQRCRRHSGAPATVLPDRTYRRCRRHSGAPATTACLRG